MADVPKAIPAAFRKGKVKVKPSLPLLTPSSSAMMPNQPDPMMQQMMMQMMQGQSQAQPQAQPNMMQVMMQSMMQQAAPSAPAQPAALSHGPNDDMQALMQSMFQMGQMHALQAAMQKAKPGSKMAAQMQAMHSSLQAQQMQAQQQMQQVAQSAAADTASMDMSAFMGSGDAAAEEDPTSEHARATQEAMAATQQAIYDQQMIFHEQARKHRSDRESEKRGGESRFKDDYRAYEMCRSIKNMGYCQKGARCEYGHCFEELHPASPDMPQDEETISRALSTLKQPPKEEFPSGPKIQLRKKRDLCRKFKESGHCSRGAGCPNAHSEAEIGKTAFVLYDKVKMEICKSHMAGRCSYGASCIYAHGEHEIGEKRREWDAPPIKKKKLTQTIEDWRYEILRDPEAPAF